MTNVEEVFIGAIGAAKKWEKQCSIARNRRAFFVSVVFGGSPRKGVLCGAEAPWELTYAFLF